MYGPALLALVTAWASLAHGEAVWQTNQVNTRICQWQQLRAAVLRDTVYLDGGDLWWQPGFADGSAGQAVNDNNRLGLIYTLNFSIPFNTTQNISAILGTLDTGGGDTDNRAPNYQDGALLGNDDEFFLYGGLLQRTDSFSDPPGSTVLGYYGYQYGAAKAAFKSEFFNKDLGSNTTRYVTYGGAASAPSENLAWYFSGFRSASGGEIYTPDTANDSTTANVVSNTLITLNLATQQQETFSNVTLDPKIPGRANPELVWVPVGSRGILVALGGVVYPDFGNYTGASDNVTASEAQSPAFMSTINIYDVAGNKWYSQNTTGGPGQLTRGCTVVARAPDGSSFNIYYYGGYDGLHQEELFNDDVWVLSLPTFTWVKLANSTADGRAGHKCVTPYPDQMLVIGGYPHYQGVNLGCLKETIRVFNLSTGTWVDRYDPAVYSNYTVPTAVVEKIGSATAPVPSGWDSNDLASVFSTQYPVSKIATYYPYPSVGPVNNTNPNAPVPSAQQDQGGSGLPSYLPPVLGVVLGLVFLTMVAVFILLWRRRRLLSGGTVSEVDTEDSNGLRIKSWLRGQPSEVKAPTVTTTSDYTPLSSTEVESVGVPPQSIAEMMNTEVQLPAELPDTSPPAELHNTTLPPSATAHSPSLNPATYYPTTHQTDHALITHTPSPIPIPSPSPSPYPSPPPIPHDDDDESPVYYRPDSDALGRAPTTSATTSPTGTTTTGMHTATASPTTAGGSGGRATKVLSGVSNLSERDHAHLRQISDTTVSSVNTAPGYHGGQAATGMATVVADRGVVESPAAVSPPTATGEGPAGDYLGARPLQGLGLAQGLGQGQGQHGGGPSSPLRRSVFSEEIGDEESGSGESGRRG